MSAVSIILSVLAPMLTPLGGTPVTPAARRADPPVPAVVLRAIARRDDEAPRVHVWTTSDAPYQRGDRVKVRFSSDADAYVFVLRVDTDGRIRVLFPRTPDGDPFIHGGDTYRLPGYAAGGFRVDDYPGVGYVFAIASRDRFVLDRYASDGYWDYHLIGGRIHDDPFVAVHQFAERILYDRDDPYTVDYAEYDVGQHYDYPRFVCYDCHTYRPYGAWDPYDHPCVRFHLVIFDDPYYYPYRYYPGTRVVYQRQPRYVFKEATGGEVVTQGTFIERRRRQDEPDLRRPGRPTNDPNVGGGRVGVGGTVGGSTGGVPFNAHARRPVQDPGVNESGNGSPSHSGLGTPRREPGGGNANDGGNGNGGNGNNGQGNGNNGQNNGRGRGWDNGVGNGGMPGNGYGRRGDPPGNPGNGAANGHGNQTPDRESTPPDNGGGSDHADRATPQRESHAGGSSNGQQDGRARGGSGNDRGSETRSQPHRSEPTRSGDKGSSDKGSSGKDNSRGRRPPAE